MSERERGRKKKVRNVGGKRESNVAWGRRVLFLSDKSRVGREKENERKARGHRIIHILTKSVYY